VYQFEDVFQTSNLCGQDFGFIVGLDKLKNSKDIDIACEDMVSWHLNGTDHSQFLITIEGKVLFAPKQLQN